MCIRDSGHVIFRQKRIGRNGKVFEIYKFRSMCVGAEKTGSGVYSGKGDARVTSCLLYTSGKTTLALHVVAEAQKLGGEAAFVDAEHALDPV